MRQQYYFIEDYQIDKMDFLGQGCQGAIYKCVKISTKEEIVSKIIKINQINEGTFEREIEIFNLLKQGTVNQNIVRVYDVILKEEEGEKMLFQFMERCETDLGKYIKACVNNQRSWPNFIEINDIAKQIIQGYQKLKECNIIHRDLKPDNILIKTIGDKQVLKITDFGLGKVLNSDCAITNTGTPLYKAPEIQSKNFDVYTNKADIFSLGVILYQIVYKNNPPVPLASSQDVIKFQVSLQHTPLKCPPVEGIPEEFLKLIQKMITYSPANRINWDELEKYFDIKKANECKNQIQDYYEYVGAIYLQSKKIQMIIIKMPHDLHWESLTVNLIQFIILKFQLELNMIIVQLISEQEERQISSIRHLRANTINKDKVIKFLENNNIVIDINNQLQQIEDLKHVIQAQLKQDTLDKFFTDFFQRQLRAKSSYEDDLFDYWLLQFQVIYKEYMRSWLVGYYQKQIITLNELYQLEKFSHILEECPKTDYNNTSILQIYSKIFIQESMIDYLRQKELL